MRLAVVAAVLVGSLAPGRAESPAPLTIDDSLETTRLPDHGSGGPFLEFSPDGTWLLAQVRRTDLEANHYRFELVAFRPQLGSPHIVIATDQTTASQHRSFVGHWSADAAQLAYLQRDGERRFVRFVAANELRAGITRVTNQIEVPAGTRDFRWSPDSRRLALLGRVEAASAAALTGVEVDVDWPESRSHGALSLLDLESKQCTRVADPDLNIAEFDWSPNGQLIVLAASRTDRWDAYMKQDLFLYDVKANSTRSLVEQPGWDGTPVWSPDSRWIAFASGEGKEDWSYSRTLAVVSAEGTNLSYAAHDYREQIGHYPYWIGWSIDSSSIYFMASAQAAHRLFRVARQGGAIEQVTPSDAASYSGFTFLPAHDKMAFAMETFAQPRDVFMSSISRFSAVRLSALNPELSRRAASTARRISWRSTDDRLEIPGILITPPDYDSRKRYPLLVIVPGGPASATLSYDVQTQYPTQIFAASGYVVLIPNTRGRNGYGEAYRRAIPAHSDYGPGPASDILAGVDHLIRQGVADPNRLGILGFSYGAYLTAYTLTRTNRFKAASLNDCGACNIPYAAFLDSGDPSAAQLRRELWGFGVPYDREWLNRMVDQSPVHQAKAVTTPCLLEFGALSHAHDHGRMLFHALRSHGVPTEMIVYPRTGHGIEEPRLKQDSYTRNLEWMDFWLRGKSVPRLEERWRRQ